MSTPFSRPGSRTAATSLTGDATPLLDVAPARPYLLLAACFGVSVLLTVIAEHIDHSGQPDSSAGTPPVKAKPTDWPPPLVGEPRRPTSRPSSVACGNMPQPGCISRD